MPKPKIYVYTKRIVLLQRLADRARNGYLHYISGSTAVEKFPALYEKFRRLYAFDLDRGARYRDRKAGRAVFSLLAYQIESDPQARITWVLMRTGGELPPSADLSESWRDAKTDRLVILDRFELARITRKGSDAPAWTWRITASEYARIREDVINAIRSKHDTELHRIIADARTWPGFAPVRDQARKLHELIKGEWARSRGSAPPPELPERIGYARRVSDKIRAIKPKKRT